MKKQKYKTFSPLSHIRIWQKFLLITFACLFAFTIIGITLTDIVNRSEREKQEALENMTVTAVEQNMNVVISNCVSVARSCYTNTALYDFLNKEYASQSDYFDAYYQWQQDNPLMLAEINIIDNYTLFSNNETIMSGGNIRNLRYATFEGWYQTVLRKNKSILLYCDPNSKTISLIRRMDYYDMTAGECFLKLDLNLSVIKNYCDSLNFDGELDIVSDGILIYSNHSEQIIDDVKINEDFEGLTKNYYTLDIEFYANANKRSVSQLLAEHWLMLTLFVLSLVFVGLLVILLTGNLQRRIRRVEELYQNEGTLIELRAEETGKDEIGGLVRIGISLSDKLTLKSNQLKHTQEQLSRRQTELRVLYSNAMRQDMELTMQHRYPSLCLTEILQYHSISKELNLVKEIASFHTESELILPKSIPNEFSVPVYAMALIADDLFLNDGVLEIFFKENLLTLHYTSNTIPPSAKILKLNAVFEEDEVMSVYPFQSQYVYNPYLYIKHSMGNRVKAVLSKENGFEIRIIISK